MKTMIRFSPLLLTLLALPGLAQPPLPLPQNTYVCHVVTRDGRDGLVFVQADSLTRARIVAPGSRAFVATGPDSFAESAVECQPRSGADFASDAADRLLGSLAR